MLALERGTVCLTVFLISCFFLTTGSGNPHSSRLPKRTTSRPLGSFSLMEHVIFIREVTLLFVTDGFLCKARVCYNEKSSMFVF